MAFINENDVAYGVLSVNTDEIPDRAITEPKLADNAVNTRAIVDGAVTEPKLADNAVTNSKIINNAVTFEKLGTSLAAKSGNAAQAWAFANDTTIPTTLLAKSWILNNTDNKIKKGEYSVGFDNDGIAVKSSNASTLGGGDFTTACIAVYVSQKVTSINNTFFVTAPNVTDLYIDNNEGEVTLPSNIPASVNVHYKGDFNLIDLIINSLVATNTKITDLDARITALES